MKVAMLADGAWAEQEMASLRRLVVGLMAEAVPVVPVMTDGQVSRALSMAGPSVHFEPSMWGWIRRWQWRRLAEQLAGLEVDLVHAMHEEMAEGALRLGRMMKLPVVCSLWSQAGIEPVARRAGRPSGQSVCLVVPTDPLQRLAEAAVGRSVAVERIRPGVLVDEQWVGPVLVEPEQALSVLVVCQGPIDEPLGMLLRGLGMIGPSMPQLQVMLYAMGGGSHKLWQAIARKKLNERVTVVDPKPGVRSLVIQADAVFQPQACGAVCSVVLEAMAAGRPVVAVADPAVDYLHEGQTAMVLDEPQAGRWAELLAQMVDDPQPFRRLGQSARQYMLGHHSASAYNAALMGLYAKMTAEPLPFEP